MADPVRPETPPAGNGAPAGTGLPPLSEGAAPAKGHAPDGSADRHATHPTPDAYAEAMMGHGPGHAHGQPHGAKYRLALALAALGVVYGDIGTSPLYALKECFHRLDVTPGNVLGVLSLVFWALIVVISIKYLAFVMRADNAGEGGILALMTLATRVKPGEPDRRGKRLFVAMGLFGAALLYGDGIITPAISVLSAMEGLNVATPFFEPYVIPLTLAIIVGLFLVQRKGTAKVGRVFGPLTLVWFGTLAVLGLLQIVQNPSVLAAANPLYGARFFAENGLVGFLVLGSVFLVVTGGEALYADMGHFGVKPIRLAWFTVVLPALLLNYFGQGALLLREPEAAENPLFNMVPEWGVIPLVVLATAATAIASQAIITGAFSLTMQGIQLGYLPRMRVLHTSKTEYGQVYVPALNAALMVACIGLVLAFQTSTNLAAAYGVGVTTDMTITAVLLFVVMRERWGWALAAALPLTALFLVVDLAFWGANIVKVPQGGWVPLVIAVLIFTVMATWRRGRTILSARMAEGALPLDLALPDLSRRATRVPGTAVFMHGNPTTTPPALLHNLKHNKVLHERVIFLRVEVLGQSYVAADERCDVEHITEEFYRLHLRYGFAEVPDVAAELGRSDFGGRPIRPMETTYFLGRERLFSTDKPGMAPWRERLFSAMSNNAANAADFFGLPPGQVIEIGARVEI